MIQGAIQLGGRYEIIFMERDEEALRQGYSANSYLAVLDEEIPRIQSPGITFMQDGARIHTARKVVNQFIDYVIPTLPWLAYSPDLNPIEHLWSILKQWITKHHPELKTMGKSNADYEALRQAIQEAWHAIDQDEINNLIRSMDHRVNHVQAANGWQTRF